MRTRLVILLIIVSAALTGCNDTDKGQKGKTVSWFLDHRDELTATLKGCGDNPGELEKTPNCINANEARNQVTVQEMEDALK